MCGIAGIIMPELERGAALERVDAMTSAMVHRGPDDHDVYADGGVALGHRRLSIIDLSAQGRQPMTSASGRYVLVFNGEIYNFAALRADLGDYPFRGRSDTEVLLAAIDAWGVERAVRRLDGDFAFAVWDRERGRLALARDRLGIKPLYYRTSPEGTAFASELKALSALPDWDPVLDPDAIADFLRLGYVPGGATGFRDVAQLAPGHLLFLDVAPGAVVEREAEAYWSLPDVAASLRGTGPTDPREALDGLEERLLASVSERLVADVPVGVFLSGGVDSTLMAAAAARLLPDPIRTFTIGFEDEAFNEATAARRTAEHLGARHREIYISEAELLARVDGLASVFDVPFADTSALPTLLLSELAREDVVVALSGDGGDETYAGYARHAQAELLGRILSLPGPVRALVGGALSAIPARTYDRLASRTVARGGEPGDRQWGGRIHKAADLISTPGRDVANGAVAGKWSRPPVRFEATWSSFDARQGRRGPPWDALDATERMMLADALSYLPGDPLVKTDRASMACSLEVRVPMLDHELVEYAWSLPLDLKLHDGRGKRLLRDLLDRWLPRELWDRPKTGFGVPIARWLRGPLRDWADDLMASAEAGPIGAVLDMPRVRRELAAVRRGNDVGQFRIWTVLMLVAWAERWRVRT